MQELTKSATGAYQSDLDLAAGIQARDRKATARLVELHTEAVYGYVWRRLVPRVDMVDDIVQDVFVAAWGAMGSYSGNASLQTWLVGIARNKVEDYYRHALSRSVVDLEGMENEDALQVDAALDSTIDSSRQAERAAEILNQLRYEYALALRWRYWDGRTAREMATVTGRTEKAVERLLARARTEFKNTWLRSERRA